MASKPNSSSSRQRCKNSGHGTLGNTSTVNRRSRCMTVPPFAKPTLPRSPHPDLAPEAAGQKQRQKTLNPDDCRRGLRADQIGEPAQMNEADRPHANADGEYAK